MKFLQKHPELWKFIKFNISLFLTSFADIAVYLFLLYCVFSGWRDIPLLDSKILSLLGIRYKAYLYSYLISTTVGYVLAYLFNRKITFHSDVSAAYSSTLYFLLAVFNIFVSSWLGGIFGTFIEAKKISSIAVQIISKFVIINIPTLWTYPLERFVIQKVMNENKIKIVASDLDGTLLTGDSSLTEKNKRAIKSIAKAGCEFVVVTGRTYYEIPLALRELETARYVIYSDGAAVYDSAEKKVIHSAYIDIETAKKVFSVLKKHNALIEIYEDGYPKTDEYNLAENNFEKYGVDAEYLPVIYDTRMGVSDIESRLSRFDKIELFNAFFICEADKKRCFDEMETLDGIEFTYSMSNNIEIMSDKATKGKALEWLCGYLGVGAESVAAMGDSSNDIPMLKLAGISLVPSNAADMIKKYADEVICSNNDSVAKYVKDNYF